jgi:tetratricopeptide (TPR) repeat protein
MGDVDKAIADFSESIRLSPGDVPAHRRRGAAYAVKHDWDKAIADYDWLVATEPKSPLYYEARGTIRIARGDLERGLADLQAAIRLNPNDQAKTFEQWPKAVIGEADLRYGEEQLRQMLKNRPTMGKYGEDADVLYRWAARKFAGEDLGGRILWDASEVPSGCSSDCQPTSRALRCIRLRGTYEGATEKGQKRPFEELWHDLVFELYNVTVSSHDFERLENEVAEGGLSRDQFVLGVINAESRAAERTRAFYIHVFLPWAKKHHVSTDPYLWRITIRLRPNESLVLPFVTKDMPYWKHYEQRYDYIVLAGLIAKSGSAKVVEATAEMLAHARTPEDKAVVYHSRGTIYAKDGQLDKAISDFSDAIRLNPVYAEAYYDRGTAYTKKGEKPRAEEDFGRAKKLGWKERPIDHG